MVYDDTSKFYNSSQVTELKIVCADHKVSIYSNVGIFEDVDRIDVKSSNSYYCFDKINDVLMLKYAPLLAMRQLQPKAFHSLKFALKGSDDVEICDCINSLSAHLFIAYVEELKDKNSFWITGLIETFIIYKGKEIITFIFKDGEK